VRPLIGLVAAIAIANPAAAQPIACPKRDSMPRPMVPTAEVAKGIYLAVEKGLKFHPNPMIHSDLVVSDGGAAWQVSRHLKPKHMKGGGQLSLRIDKCSGEISHAWFAK
jgi:hypothetical protein